MAPLFYTAKFDHPTTLLPGAIKGKEGIKFCHLATPLSPLSLSLSSLSIWDPIYIHYRRTFSRHVAPEDEGGDVAALRKRSSIVVRVIVVAFVGGGGEKNGLFMGHAVQYSVAPPPWQYSAGPPTGLLVEEFMQSISSRVILVQPLFHRAHTSGFQSTQLLKVE